MSVPPTPPVGRAVRLKTPRDVRRALARVFNRLLRGEIEEAKAGKLAYLAGYLLKAMEQGELEQRLERIEKEMGLDESLQLGERVR